MIIEKRRIVDAKDWIIKYFITASVGYILFVFFNKGIIDNKLISIPNHIIIQECAEIEIKVPKIKVLKNKIL